jgi:spore maturation protein CgeB
MKVLLVGSQKDWAFENHYNNHLQNLGAEVSCFPAHDLFYEFYYKSIFNKIIFRLGISNIYKKINHQLLIKTKSEKFDVVWVFKGMELFPETIRKIRERGIKMVNFNPDHPFLHTFRGSGNNLVRNSIPFYDLHLCYSIPVKEKIEREFNIKCHWLPFGYEQDKTQFPGKEEEKVRACFIGNPDPYRSMELTKLVRSGIPLDLYGNNWENWIKRKPGYDIQYFPPVYKNDFNRVARPYRLQLNIFRPHNDNSHNMRTFEMPGLGCIMLAPESEEHLHFFKENEEAFYFKDSHDMVQKSKKILGFSYPEALQIRKAALHRSLSSGYSYQDRAKQVLQMFHQLITD